MSFASSSLRSLASSSRTATRAASQRVIVKRTLASAMSRPNRVGLSAPALPRLPRPSTRLPIVAIRTMFIQTESTPNDDSLKFIPGMPVMGDGTAEFLDTKSALASPLALRLIGIEGITGVFYGPDFVTVTKDSEHPWSVVKPEVYAVLMESFSSGQPLFRSQEERDAAGPQDTRILDTDSETVAMIKELLETRVRPAIMEDGGDIEYRGFDENDSIVRVKLKGSCRGCESSSVTLKSGIERMLMHYIPEVKGVEQASDIVVRCFSIITLTGSCFQVLDQEEEVALNEFQKLEEKLQGGKKDSVMAQYMSV